MRLVTGFARRCMASALAGVLGLTAVMSGVSPASASASVDATQSVGGAVAVAGAPPPRPPQVLRELADKRTDTSDAYLLSDGTTRVEYYAERVNFRDPNTKKMLPIDASLADTSSAGRTVSVNRANSFRLQLPKTLSGDWVSVEASGAKIALRPSTRARLGAALAATGTVTARSVSATDRAYPSAFAGTTLSYESRVDGVKETIVVSKPTSASVYSFDLGLAGATARLEADGSISITRTGDTTPTFAIPAPSMWDATNGATGDGFSTDVHYELTGATSPYRLDIVCDAAWLSDPARVYPVTIDPSVQTYSITGTGASTNPADTYISSKAANQDQRYASATLIWLNRNDPSANWTEHGFIHPGTALVADLAAKKAAGYDVVASRLKQLIQAAYLPRTGQYKGVMCDPAEYVSIGASTWNTYAAGNPSTVATCSTPYLQAVAGWNTLDVTNMVDYWQNNATPADNCCTMLVADPATKPHFGLNSCDGSSGKPVWEVDYAPVPVVTLTAPKGEAAARVPNAAWTYSEALGNPQVEYQIEIATSPTSASIATTDVSSAATNAPLPVPVGGWASGQRYFVHVRAASLPSGQTQRQWSAWSAWGSFTPTLPERLRSLVGSPTASASWFTESDMNGDGLSDARDDSNASGRGSVSLAWSPAEGATGYDIYLSDGTTYRKVDSTTATSWSSAGRGLYPSDSAIASRSVGATSCPFLAAGGGLDLRDDPRPLFAKTAPSAVTTLGYTWCVSPTNSFGSLPASANADCVVALENRTVHLHDDPSCTTADLGSLFGDDAQVRVNQGCFTLHATDLSIPGLGPNVSVERVYRSSSVAREMCSPGWRFAFQQHVTVNGRVATYYDEDSDAHEFVEVDGAWLAPRGNTDVLSGSSGSGFALSHKDRSVTRFGADGRLDSETDANGNTVRYDWAADGSALTIRSPKDVWLLHERRITVFFDAAGRVTSAVAHVGGGDPDRVVAYDAAPATLTVVRLPGTDSARTTVYRYDGAAHVSAVVIPGFAPSANGEAVWNVSYGSTGTTLCVANDTGAGTPRMPQTVAWNSITGTATIASASGTATVAFDRLGQEIARTSENTSASTATAYDSDGNCVHEVSPSGRSTTVAFDGRGNVVSQTDQAGATTRYTYANDLCVHELDARGADTWRAFDSAGNLLSEEKTLNETGDKSRVDRAYNADGSLIWEKTKVDATRTAEVDHDEYNDSGIAEKTTYVGVELAEGGPTQNLVKRSRFNGFGEQTSATDALGKTVVTNSLDAAGRVIGVSDAGSTLTRVRYDVLGNAVETWRSSESSPGLKVDWRTSEFDGAGNIVTETVRASTGATVSTTVHAFDAAGREVKTDDSAVPGASVTQYDAQSNVAKSWDEGSDTSKAAAATRATYDAEGEQTAELDPGALSASTDTSYTTRGQVASESAATGADTQYAYDEAGDLATQTVSTDVGPADTGYDTDLDGRATEVVDSNDTTVTTSYDLAGNEIGAKLGDQNVSATRVNTLGWTLRTTDFDGVDTTSTYDADGREVRRGVGGLATTSEYDDCGRVWRQSNADGTVVTYAFDPFGRRTGTTQTRGAQTLNVNATDYDSAGRIWHSAEISSVSSASVGRTRTYGYSADGTVSLSETRRAGDVRLDSLRDGAGLTRSFSATIGGKSVDWSVLSTDLAGRVTASTSGALPLPRTATYSEAGQLKKATLGSDSAAYTFSAVSGKKTHDSLAFRFPGRAEETTYSYDCTGRVTSSLTGGSATTYSYDPATGALAGYRRGAAATVTLSYDRDGTGRLTTAGSRSYASDSIGRRLRVGPSANPSETVYGWTADRLTTLTTPATRAVYTYDASGQRIRSVLSTGSSTSTTTDFDYDGTRLLGIAGSRSDGATWTVDYLYDESGKLFAGVYQSSTSTWTPFLVATTDRGDVRELLDSSGDAFAYYAYDAYGVSTDVATRGSAVVPAATAAAIASRQVLRYAGYAYDAESGLYYCSARYYDPAVASFISKDPAKADGEESPYQYCAGDPVGSDDPTGLDSPKDSPTAGAYGPSWSVASSKSSKKKHRSSSDGGGRHTGGGQQGGASSDSISDAGSEGIYRHYTASQYARIRSRIIQNARQLKAWKIRYSQGDQLPKNGGQLDCSGAVGWVLHNSGLAFVNGPGDESAGRWTTNEFYTHLGIVGGRYGSQGYSEKRFSPKSAWHIGDVIVTRHGQGSNHVVVMISDGPNPQVFESRGSKNGAYIGPLSARLATWHGKVSGRFFGLK